MKLVYNVFFASVVSWSANNWNMRGLREPWNYNWNVFIHKLWAVVEAKLRNILSLSIILLSRICTDYQV